VYWKLLVDIKNTPSLMNKIKFAFKNPGWDPNEKKDAYQRVQNDLNKKFNPEINLSTKSYILSQFFITVTLSLIAPSLISEFNYTQTFFFISFLAFSLYTHGISLEARPTTPYAESLRLIGLLVLSFALEINEALYIAIALSAALPLLLIASGNGRLIFQTN
jgi:hypothetical protein